MCITVLSKTAGSGTGLDAAFAVHAGMAARNAEELFCAGMRGTLPRMALHTWNTLTAALTNLRAENAVTRL